MEEHLSFEQPLQEISYADYPPHLKELIEKYIEDNNEYNFYLASTITFPDENTIVIMCINDKLALEAQQNLNCLLHVARLSSPYSEEEFIPYVKRTANQITLTGEIRFLTPLLAEANCINEELLETIFSNERFNQLAPLKQGPERDPDEVWGGSPEAPRKLRP